MYKPGSLAPKDGMYIEVDKKGNIIDNAFSMKKGENFRQHKVQM